MHRFVQADGVKGEISRTGGRYLEMPGDETLGPPIGESAGTPLCAESPSSPSLRQPSGGFYPPSGTKYKKGGGDDAEREKSSDHSRKGGTEA